MPITINRQIYIRIIALPLIAEEGGREGGREGAEGGQEEEGGKKGLIGFER